MGWAVVGRLSPGPFVFANELKFANSSNLCSMLFSCFLAAITGI